jgi:tetratricopeptide (TPR) repeat protein
MIFRLLILLISLSYPLTAAADDRLLGEAFALLDAGRTDAAITSFRAILKTDPDNLKAEEGLAWAYYEKRDFAAAARHADARLSLAPASTDWRQHWVTILLEVPERQDELLSTARSWAEEAPMSPAAQILLGSVLANRGSFAEGREILSAVLKQHPDNVEALVTLANIERWDQRYREARVLLDRATLLKPEDDALRRELQGVTREVNAFRAAHLEPTLPMTLALVFGSILLGQASSSFSLRTYAAIFAGCAFLVAAALVWLNCIPLS